MTNENNPMTHPLPHQQALIDQFFDETMVRGYVAQWDVGLGSVWTVALLIKRFTAANPACRVLVLSPKMLTYQTHYHLESVGLQTDLVDRFRFRAMEDTAPSSEPVWREGGIYLLGTDFAKQDDIATSLCSVEWDLLIVLESHQIRGKKEQMVKRLVKKSPRLRVILWTLPGVGDLPKLGIEPWKHSTVRQNEVVDAKGRRIFDLPAPVVRVVEVARDPAEGRLRDAVAEVLQLLNLAKDPQRILGMIIENSMHSSLAALEEVLRRTRNSLAHGKVAMIPNFDDDDETDVDNVPSLEPADNSALLAALQKCLTEIESISDDTKLDKLARMLTNDGKDGIVPRSSCILTKYSSTLDYVYSALDELGFATIALRATKDFDFKLQEIEECKKYEGILISTIAALEGISLPNIESLVLYDLPSSPLVLRQILGRFQRYGRAVPLTISVFSDQVRIDMLRDILRENSGKITEGGDTPAA